MFYKFFITATLTLLVLSQTPERCMPKRGSGPLAVSPIPDLQAGNVEVYKKGSNSRFTSFNKTLSRTITNAQIAITFENISSFSPKNGMDFQVTAILSHTYFHGGILMEVQAQWQMITLSFVVSGRQDFIVGSFLAGTSEIYSDNNILMNPASNNTQITLSYTLPYPKQLPFLGWMVIPFVSGLRTFEKDFSFKFLGRRFNPKTKQLDLIIKTSFQLYPIEFVSISFLLFHNRHELEVISLYDFSISDADTFHGVSDIISKSANFNPNALPIDNNPRPILRANDAQYELFDEMFGLHGVAVQTETNLDLVFSTFHQFVGQFTCISKKQCKARSGHMVYRQNHLYDITPTCYVCGNNSFFNQTAGSCQCNVDYTLVNGSCMPTSSVCGIHQFYSTVLHKCICARLYTNISGTCLSIFDLCGSNQVYFIGKCIRVVFNKEASPCPSGYVIVNQKCQKKRSCQAPLTLNAASNQCQCPKGMNLIDGQCKCGTNEEFVGGQCKCWERYGRINGKCRPCSPYAFSNQASQKCMCLRNYQGDGFSCKLSGTKESHLSDALTGSFPGGSRIVP